MSDSLAGAKILVTGGAGFLGRHLLPRLIAAGAEPTCLIRSRGASLPVSVQTAMGDCTDAEAVAKAADGQDYVIHMAGLLFGAAWNDYLKANETYAWNVAKAAGESVKRVVFVSSLAAAGPSVEGKKESEMPAPVSAYGWSKLAAEGILQASLGERLAILRPPVIYGSGDRALLPLFKSCRRGLGITPAGNFPLSLIHADDAADAIIACLFNEASGIYHLSDGAVHTMKEVCAAIGASQGVKSVISLSTPSSILALSAAAGTASNRMIGFWQKATGKRNPRYLAWNWDKYREARQPGWVANPEKIQKELGFAPKLDLAAGMEEATAGYRRDGWL